MSFVVTQPELLAAAARVLHRVGPAMAAHNATAAVPTTGAVPAVADEVSALTATQFAMHAQTYQQVSAQAATVTATLAISAGSYAATEAADAVAAS